jgi:hypothetical protein
VQYALRLTPAERKPMDDLFAELRVTSMSELVTTIVQLGVEHDQAAVEQQ